MENLLGSTEFGGADFWVHGLLKWTSFKCNTSLAGCKLHSSACQFQPTPVGGLFVQSGWTEVRHGYPAGYSTTAGEHPGVSGSYDNKGSIVLKSITYLVPVTWKKRVS